MMMVMVLMVVVLMMVAMMVMVLVVTLKTREESPRPMVAMSPPRTDVALRPILWRKVLKKQQEKEISWSKFSGVKLKE